MVEFSCHGGVSVLMKVLELVIRLGARLAEPGEFTKRAFLAGRIDLSQAEAVIDIIRAKTDSARRLALANLRGDLSSRVNRIRDNVLTLIAHIEASIDFPDEAVDAMDVEDMVERAEEAVAALKELADAGMSSRVYRDGVSVVFVGRPNVGKSSLFNALVGKARAIVTDIPGTTRDVIDDWISIKGVPLRLVDTAGMRETGNLIEQLGVEAANRQAEEADLVIAVIDGSRPVCDEELDMLTQVADKSGVVAINKCDLECFVNEESLMPYAGDKKILRMSAKTGEGLRELEEALAGLAVERIIGHLKARSWLISDSKGCRTRCIL